jgi:alkylhydroperoxidase family enzyme
VSRIPRPTRAELDDEQRELYDAIAGGPRAKNPFGIADAGGALDGPFNAMLLHPPVGDAEQRLGAAIRYRGSLSDRAREIAVLTVAASVHSGFEQYAHEHLGRELGLTDGEIEALRAGRLPELADPEEAAVAEFTRSILDTGTLDDDQFARAGATLGTGKLYELSTVIGYYRMIALQLRIFGVDAPR